MSGGFISYDLITYDKGVRLIPGSITYISPDECIIRAADAQVMRLRCSRPGHPTATSDCGRPGATIEPPEVAT